MFTKKLEFKLLRLILILLTICNSFGMESNSSKDFFGGMEGKIESFSDLISFDPSSISTDCPQIKQKYEDYSEAMAFTHGLSEELMSETMQNLGQLRTVTHELSDQVGEQNELGLRQEKLLELRAERKAQEMQWRDDWNKRHILMEQERQKAAAAGTTTGAFVQTGAHARLKQLETDISTSENEIKQLQLESEVYEQKIYQIQDEAQLMKLEVDKYDQDTQQMTDMINTFNTQFEKFESMKMRAETQEEIDKIQEQESPLYDQYNQLVTQIGDLQVERNNLVMKLMTKQQEIQKYADKQTEATQQIITKNIQISELKAEQTSITSSVESSQSTESSTSTSTTTTTTTTTTYTYSSTVLLYSESYYQLESQQKEISMKKSILTQDISSYQYIIDGYNQSSQLTQEQEIEKEQYANQLANAQEEMTSFETESQTIEGQIEQEQNNVIQSGNLNANDETLPYSQIDVSSITEGEYSKLYYLFQARLTQVSERIQVIISTLEQIETELIDVLDEDKAGELENQKKQLEEEKIYREKEKAALEVELEKEKLKAQGLSTTNEITYSEQYYEYKRLYETTNVQLSLLMTQIIEIENEILMIQQQFDQLTNDAEKQILFKKIAQKGEEKVNLQIKKNELVTSQETYTQSMTEEIDKMENEAASKQDASATAKEQLIMYIKRYNEIGLELKTIFMSLEEYRNKINEIYQGLQNASLYDASYAAGQFEFISNYNIEIQKLEVSQASLRQQQETIISQIQIILSEGQKVKEINYLQKYAEMINITLPYQLSSITTLPCETSADTNESLNISATSTLDSEVNTTETGGFDISATSTLDSETTGQTTGGFDISATSTLDSEVNTTETGGFDISATSTLDSEAIGQTTGGFDISSISTLDSAVNTTEDQDYNISSTSTLDNKNSYSTSTLDTEYDISSTSTLDNQNSYSTSTLDNEINAIHKHKKHSHYLTKSLLEFPDAIKLQYSNLALLQQNIPCEANSEGIIEINTAATSVKYSVHYFKLLTEMEELLTQYQALIKSYYEIKQQMSKYLLRKEQGILSEVDAQQLETLEASLESKQTEETQLSSQIDMTQKGIEMERIEALDKAIQQNFTEVLHALVINYAKLKVQYQLIVIRMKSITIIKQLIIKRTTQFYTELQTSSYSEEQYKLFYFELYYLNLFMLELDQLSIQINEQKMAYFTQLRSILLQISQEQAITIGEESPFVIDETTSTGVGSGNQTEQDQQISEELTELQQAIIKLSQTLDYSSRLSLLIKILKLIKQEKVNLVYKQISIQQMIKKLIFGSSMIQANITTIEARIQSYEQQIVYLQEQKQQTSKISEEVSSIQERITLLKAYKDTLDAAIQPFQQELQIYQYSFEQITQQIGILEQQLTKYEKKLNELKSGENLDLDSQEEINTTESELTDQIYQLLIDIEDPSKSGEEKETIQKQLLDLLEQQIKVASSEWEEQSGITYGYQQQMEYLMLNTQGSMNLITFAYECVNKNQNIMAYETMYQQNSEVDYQGRITECQSIITKEEALQSQYETSYQQFASLFQESLPSEQILLSNLESWMDLQIQIEMASFIGNQSTPALESSDQTQTVELANIFFDIPGIELELKEMTIKFEEFQKQSRVNLDEIKLIVLDPNNYNQYKEKIVALIPDILSKLTEYQEYNPIELYNEQIAKFQKKQSIAQKLVSAYTKYAENSERYQQTLNNAKLFQIAIRSCENFKNNRILLNEQTQKEIDFYTNILNSLTQSTSASAIDMKTISNEQEPIQVQEEALSGEYTSLDLSTTDVNILPNTTEEQVTGTMLTELTTTTQQMIDYYWANEASLSDCEKADLLKDISDRLLDIELDRYGDAQDTYLVIHQNLQALADYDGNQITIYQALMANSEANIEDYEDLIDYHTYWGHNALVEYYEDLIDNEENFMQPQYTGNITYYTQQQTIHQAAADAYYPTVVQSNEEADWCFDLFIYYDDLWFDYAISCGTYQAPVNSTEESSIETTKYQINTEHSELLYQLLTNITLENLQKIDIINNLIPLAKQLISIAIQEQGNVTNAIFELQKQKQIKNGEKSAKKIMGDKSTDPQSIEQINKIIMTIDSELTEMEALITEQIMINSTFAQRINNLELVLTLLQQELLKLQAEYGNEFGVYNSIEFPQQNPSKALVSQSKVDEQFFSYILNLKNVEYNISARIVTYRRLIEYMQQYIVNITKYTASFTTYINLLESSKLKYDSLMKAVQTQSDKIQNEINQNSELKEYYISQNMEQRANEIEVQLEALRQSLLPLQMEITQIQLSLTYVTNEISFYTMRISYRQQQLLSFNSQLQFFQTQYNNLESQYAQQKSSTIAKGSIDTSSIDTEINDLTRQSITITTRILKITKIVTTIRTQITIITKKSMTIKSEISKLVTEQYKLNIQIGIFKAQIDSYMIKITKLQFKIQQLSVSGDQTKINELQQQLTAEQQQLETSQSQMDTLNASYTQIQTQIDTYLIEENKYSEQIINQKQQLITYQKEQKQLGEQQKQIENGTSTKQIEKQEKQQEHLEKEKEHIEDMKEELQDKKTERDVACKIPGAQPEPVPEEVKVEEQYEEHVDEREEPERRRPDGYQPYEWEDEKPIRKEEPKETGAQEGFKERIPGNPYKDPTWKPEEEIYRKPKTDKRFDYGWEQFLREREEEKKNRNLTLAKPEPHIPYVKENVEEGVYRIKRRLHDILNYQFGDDEFFFQIKSTVERYLKVLVEKEHIMKTKEIKIKERTIKIENSERRIEYQAENVKQDLVRCQLDFPEIQKKAEEIKHVNYTEHLEKKIQEKQEELEEQKKSNVDAEKEVEELEDKVEEETKETIVREKKLEETNPEVFTYEAPNPVRRPRPQGSTEPLPDYTPTDSYVPPEVEKPGPKPIKEPETEKEKEQEQLEEEEDKLDKEIEESDEPEPDVAPEEQPVEKKKKEIEKTEEKIKIEEKKIEVEKKQLEEEKNKLDEQIEQCKLDFGSGEQSEANDSMSSEEKEKFTLCVTNKDQFDEDKLRLEHEISQYEELFKELQEEKSKFQEQKEQMKDFQVSGSYEERQQDPTSLPIMSEIRKSVHKQALWKHINKQLRLVNELAQSNAKQQRNLQNKMKQMKVQQKEHLAAVKSMKYIQSFTEKIAAKLNLILSEYPEDREKLRTMTADVVKEIDRLYELTMKQRRIVSSIEILRTKQRQLLTMKSNCIEAEKLLTQPSFVQNLLQVNQTRKRAKNQKNKQ